MIIEAAAQSSAEFEAKRAVCRPGTANPLTESPLGYPPRYGLTPEGGGPACASEENGRPYDDGVDTACLRRDAEAGSAPGG